MVRTQVYLTEDEKNGLGALAKTTGKKQAELIREAVDQLIESAGESQREAAIKSAAGMWKNREDLLDMAAVRSSWDRN